MNAKPQYLPARQERSQKTLDALLVAVEELLEHKTYSEISLTELVQKAGVTTGAFYSRFKSKNDLLPILYDRYQARLTGQVKKQLAASRWEGLGFGARAKRVTDFICDLFEAQPDLYRAMVIYSRTKPTSRAPSNRDPSGDPLPQYLLIQTLCERLTETLEHEDKPEPADMEFAVYTAITLARESILFPGLPMASALGLNSQELRAKLTRLLEYTLRIRCGNQ